MNIAGYRVSPLLTYGVGLLLGYTPQTVSGDADTVLYTLTVVIGLALIVVEIQKWREEGAFE